MNLSKALTPVKVRLFYLTKRQSFTLNKKKDVSVPTVDTRLRKYYYNLRTNKKTHHYTEEELLISLMQNESWQHRLHIQHSTYINLWHRSYTALQYHRQILSFVQYCGMNKIACIIFIAYSCINICSNTTIPWNTLNII